MTNPNSNSDRSLNRPQHPSQSTSAAGATKTPTPESKATPSSLQEILETRRAEGVGAAELAPEQPPAEADKRRALAASTSVAHGLRTSMNGQVDHIRSLQGAYYQAADNIAEDASDFFAAAISGQYIWGNIHALTQEKLATLPKSERVDLAPAQELLPPPSTKRNGATQNRYLPSAAGLGELPPAA